MQDDQVRYWQDLTENYRQMSDRELLELAAKPEDLTEVAQQVLRDEMRMRQLHQPQPRTMPARFIDVPRKNYDLLTGPLPDSYLVPSESEDAGDDGEDGEGASSEYTWKTRLCDCRDIEEATQLSEVLRRAGIDSWIEAMPSYAIGVGNPRVLVAADQLEEARAIAERPIPQDIIDESKIEVPEYTVPACPKCGAPDPILECVDPVNAWSCESCGAEWTDKESSAPQGASEESSMH